MQTQVFQFQTNKPVRVEYKDGEPLFCLTDVADVLEIQNPRQLKLKEKGVCKIYTPTNSGKQELLFIDEFNLYRVIFRSNKPEAVKFQDWIFEEVIPEIRRSGSYTGYLKLSPAQKQQIQEAVNRRVIRTGETHQGVYSKLHAYCRVNSYHEIHAADFDRALGYLNSIQDAPELFRQPATKKLRNLEGALIHGMYCAEFIYHHREALRILNRKLAATINDHAKDGVICLRNVAEQAGIRLPGNEYFRYFPWDGDYYEKNRYYQLNHS